MAKSACTMAGVAAAGTVLLSGAITFVPSVLGARSGMPMLRAPATADAAGVRSSPAPCMVAGVAMTAAAMGAALLRRLPQTRHAAGCRGVQRHGAARELAVAYEDSGISLIDNGKFAQGLVGSEGAWGRYEFDPIGFSKYTELVPYLREAEIKHGRVAMLAWLGLVVPDFVRIPGERYSFEAVPVTIDAHDAFKGAAGVDVQILLWIAVLELCCSKKVFEWNSLEVAGDYGLRQLFPSDEEGQKKMRISELKNGRLAMVAFGGAITQAVITRHPFPWLF